MKKHKVCNCPSDEYQRLSPDGARCIACGGLNFGYVIYAKTDNKKEKK